MSRDNVDLYAIYFYSGSGYYYNFYVKCSNDDLLNELTCAIMHNEELNDSAIWIFGHSYAIAPNPSVIQLYSFIIENLAKERDEFKITYQKIVSGRSCWLGGGEINPNNN